MNHIFKLILSGLFLIFLVSSYASDLSSKLEKMPKPWTEPTRRPSLLQYIGIMHYWEEKYPEYYKLEKVADSLKNKPVYLAIITDQKVSDDNKNVILITGFHSGAERTGALALLNFMEWLLGDSKTAVESREKNIILMMPLVNPDGFFGAESNFNPKRIDPYSAGRGRDFDIPNLKLKNPQDSPEISSYIKVCDRFKPDFHIDVHGVALHKNGHLQPSSIGSAFSNSALRPWDDRINELMMKAGNKAGFGYHRMEQSAQRIFYGPQMKGLKDYCWWGNPYFYTAMYSYFKYHTMISTMETTWNGAVIYPLIGLLEKANSGFSPGPVKDFKVNILKTSGDISLFSYGNTKAERRASRASLWHKQRNCAIGSLYPKYDNYFMAFVAYGKNGLKSLTGSSSSGRWGQIPKEKLLDNISKIKYVDTAVIKNFLSYSCPRAIKFMYEKPEKPGEKSYLNEGISLLYRISYPDPEILDLRINGKELELDANAGYQKWNEDGFTFLKINIPADRCRKENIFLLSCAFKPREKRTYGWLPTTKANEWINNDFKKSEGYRDYLKSEK
jgi:hypothetical protein